MYVVWYETHFQDGHEDHAEVFPSVEKALAFIERRMGFSSPDRTDFRLFRLGEEVPLSFAEKVRVEKVRHVTRTVKVRGK